MSYVTDAFLLVGAGAWLTVSFTHIAEQISPSTVSLSWDFTFDRAVDGL